MRSSRSGSARTCSSSPSAAAAGRGRGTARSGTTSGRSRSGRSASAACARLGIERIDLYQVHWPDWTTGTLLEESWGTMAALVDEGKARWVGVSNFDVEQLERCEAIRHVDSVQPPLSLLVRGALSTVVPWALEHGAGVLGYSPLASGLLTGTFDRERIAPLRRGRLAARRARVPGSAARREPRARGRAACDRGRARDDGHGARDRVGTGAAGRHGEYRRGAPAGSRRRLGGRGRSRAERGHPRRESARRSPRPGLGPTCRRHRRRTSGLSRTDEPAKEHGA